MTCGDSFGSEPEMIRHFMSNHTLTDESKKKRTGEDSSGSGTSAKRQRRSADPQSSAPTRHLPIQPPLPTPQTFPPLPPIPLDTDQDPVASGEDNDVTIGETVAPLPPTSRIPTETPPTPGDAPPDNHCVKCGRYFDTLNALIVHKREVHRKSFRCRSCGELFAGGRQLTAHTISAHPQEDSFRSEGDDVVNDERFNDELDSPPHSSDDRLTQLLSTHWQAIRSRLRRRNVVDLLNCRLWNGDDTDGVQAHGAKEKLKALWRDIPCRVKINCSVGVVLKHKTTGELRYFHSSSNNASLFDFPRLLSSEDQVDKFYSDFVSIDLRERGAERRPSTVWALRMVTNVTFFVYKMLSMGKVGGVVRKGGGNFLPAYILTNRNILALSTNRSTRRPYEDKLCFFRCLAVFQNCKCKGKCICSGVCEKQTKALFGQ
jgi:hypothetical protein